MDISGIYTMVRAAVSGDKYRLRSGQYDLDLTYITERIIAMGFPAAGVESTFRNWIDDVAGYLKSRHPDSFMVFNLCERDYSAEKFDHQVHRFAFPDHHPPPLPLLSRLCSSMLSWLNSSPSNVVAIHCLAGKGRTGTVIAAFLVYAGLFDSASDALNYFALKRSSNNWGVTSPSQKRYVQYFADMVVNKRIPHGQPLRITNISITAVPAFSTVYIDVYDASQGVPLELLRSTDRQDIHDTPRQFNLNVELAGDYLISVKQVRALLSPVEICRLSFNTGMTKPEGGVLTFTKLDIDTAVDDERFPIDFKIDITLSPGDSPYVDTEVWVKIPANRDGAICFNEPDAKEKANRLRASLPSEIVCVKGGYLTKQGEKVKSWKKRWFALKGRALCYFNQPKDTIPLGTISLDEVIGIQHSNDLEGYSFEILTVRRRYHIMSTSKEDRDDWVHAIRVATSNVRSQLSAGQPKLAIACEVSVLDIRMSPQFLATLPPYFKGIYVVLSFEQHLHITDTIWNFTSRFEIQQSFKLDAKDVSPPGTMNALVFMRTSPESPNTTDLPVGVAYINLSSMDKQGSDCWYHTVKHETHELTGVDVRLVIRFDPNNYLQLSPAVRRRDSMPTSISPISRSDAFIRRTTSSPTSDILAGRDRRAPQVSQLREAPASPTRSSPASSGLLSMLFSTPSPSLISSSPPNPPAVTASLSSPPALMSASSPVSVPSLIPPASSSDALAFSSSPLPVVDAKSLPPPSPTSSNGNEGRGAASSDLSGSDTWVMLGSTPLDS